METEASGISIRYTEEPPWHKFIVISQNDSIERTSSLNDTLSLTENDTIFLWNIVVVRSCTLSKAACLYKKLMSLISFVNYCSYCSFITFPSCLYSISTGGMVCVFRCVHQDGLISTRVKHSDHMSLVITNEPYAKLFRRGSFVSVKNSKYVSGGTCKSTSVQKLSERWNTPILHMVYTECMLVSSWKTILGK